MILYLKGSAALDSAIKMLVKGVEYKVFSLYCGGFSEITGWASFDKSKFVLLTGSDCSAAAMLKRVDYATAEMLWACGSGKATNVGSDFVKQELRVAAWGFDFGVDQASIFAYGTPHMVKLDSLGAEFSERIKNMLNAESLPELNVLDVRNPRHRHHAVYKEWQKGGYDVEYLSEAFSGWKVCLHPVWQQSTTYRLIKRKLDVTDEKHKHHKLYTDWKDCGEFPLEYQYTHQPNKWYSAPVPTWDVEYNYRRTPIESVNHKWHHVWLEWKKVGGKVEFRPKSDNQWTLMTLPAWDSLDGEYRVPKPVHVSDPSHVHHALWQQWQNGTKIECLQIGGGWYELVDPNWAATTTYRVKPLTVDMEGHKHHAVWKLWNASKFQGRECRVECANGSGAWTTTLNPEWDTNLEYRIVFPTADHPAHKHHALWKLWKESVAKGYPLQIECRLADDRHWVPVLREPNWLNRLQYRAKPFVPTKRIEGKIGDTIFSYLAPSEVQIDGWFKCGRFYWEPKARATYHEMTKLMRGYQNGD